MAGQPHRLGADRRPGVIERLKLESRRRTAGRVTGRVRERRPSGREQVKARQRWGAVGWRPTGARKRQATQGDRPMAVSAGKIIVRKVTHWQPTFVQQKAGGP